MAHSWKRPGRLRALRCVDRFDRKRSDQRMHCPTFRSPARERETSCDPFRWLTRGKGLAGSARYVAWIDSTANDLIGECTARLSVLPLVNGKPVATPSDGSLVEKAWPAPRATLRGSIRPQTI